MTTRPPHKRRNEEEARDLKAGPPTTSFTFCAATRRRGSAAPLRLLPRVLLGALLGRRVRGWDVIDAVSLSVRWRDITSAKQAMT